MKSQKKVKTHEEKKVLPQAAVSEQAQISQAQFIVMLK